MVFNSNEYYYVKSLIKIYSLYVIVAFSYTIFFYWQTNNEENVSVLIVVCDVF